MNERWVCAFDTHFNKDFEDIVCHKIKTVHYKHENYPHYEYILIWDVE